MCLYRHSFLLGQEERILGVLAIFSTVVGSAGSPHSNCHQASSDSTTPTSGRVPVSGAKGFNRGRSSGTSGLVVFPGLAGTSHTSQTRAMALAAKEQSAFLLRSSLRHCDPGSRNFKNKELSDRRVTAVDLPGTLEHQAPRGLPLLSCPQSPWVFQADTPLA